MSSVKVSHTVDTQLSHTGLAAGFSWPREGLNGVVSHLIVPLSARISPSPVRCCGCAPLHGLVRADQQSGQLLALAAITIDIATIFAVALASSDGWECHGKIGRRRNGRAGEGAAPSNLRDRGTKSQIEGVGSKIGPLGIIDLPPPYSGAPSTPSRITPQCIPTVLGCADD